jgi:NAD(P)-dependent dehydrogenase (short-subunit alcohol dehydrogenase family)
MDTKKSFHLDGRVVVLTGGAGQYGRPLAAQLAEAGATLVLASRNVAALQKIADEERARGYDAHAFPLDQGDEKSILSLRDQIVAKFGRVDGLVNNAVLRPAKELTEKDPAKAWEESMRVNGTGVYVITRAFGEAMAQKKTGSIVNIGSIYGMMGPTFSFYEGTNLGVGIGDYFYIKGGMITLTRYFAAVYGPSGVRVNCLSPGGFYNNQPQAFVERYNKSTFLGRMAGTRDLGGPVTFLLSEAASYITGANLPVDGGFTAH